MWIRSDSGRTQLQSQDERAKKLFVALFWAGSDSIHRGVKHCRVVPWAESDNCHTKLQFQEREVKKRYVAVVEGRVAEKEGHISFPIEGKDAETDFKVLRESRCCAAADSYLTTLELRPLQGRTHHLRIHCSRVRPWSIPFLQKLVCFFEPQHVRCQ